MNVVIVDLIIPIQEIFFFFISVTYKSEDVGDLLLKLVAQIQRRIQLFYSSGGVRELMCVPD